MERLDGDWVVDRHCRESAKATPGRQYTVWDSALPGFGLRIGSEVKAWTVMVGKDRRRITIGRYPTMGLQAARLEAKRLILAASIARNQPQITVVPFSAALDEFVELRLTQNRPNTAKERERVLRKHFEPVWKTKLLTEITRTDVNRVLDGIVHEAPIMANNAFATIRLFLRWAIRRGYLANSPCEALQSPAKRVTRDRVLSREELKKVLAAARGRGTFGTIVTLLTCTAQRRGEIAALRSEWIDRDNRLLVFPRSITKNGQEHVLPATPFVVGLLPEHKGLLFPARGQLDRAFNGWSKSMSGLRSDCGIDDFTLHDLRRTAATRMAELGTPPHILERILNHISGGTAQSITPIGRIYNRHLYLNEMREALTGWEEQVLRLLGT
jgi:integrase